MWMGHDAKVSLKHYAQTTEEHYDRAAGGANSGARKAQNAAQHVAAGSREELNGSGASDNDVVAYSNPCDLSRDGAE
jgi:hypothetical protein